MTLFPWDEINSLENKAEEALKQAHTGDFRAVVDKYIDEVDELFEMDFFYGVEDLSMQLGRSIDPDFSDVRKVIDKKVAGKDYKQRLNEYFKNGTPYDIARVVATDAHRIYNEAMYETALKAGATTKKWHCLMMPTSRDTHVYLDGVEVPLDAEFYSFNGDSTYFPGQWGVAEEDINCCCYLTYK